MKKKVTLKIPYELYVTLKSMVKRTGFSSVNEFVVFVMRTIAKGGDIGKGAKLTQDDIDAIKERLKQLGYIK